MKPLFKVRLSRKREVCLSRKSTVLTNLVTTSFVMDLVLCTKQWKGFLIEQLSMMYQSWACLTLKISRYVDIGCYHLEYIGTRWSHYSGCFRSFVTVMINTLETLLLSE